RLGARLVISPHGASQVGKRVEGALAADDDIGEVDWASLVARALHNRRGQKLDAGAGQDHLPHVRTDDVEPVVILDPFHTHHPTLFPLPLRFPAERSPALRTPRRTRPAACVKLSHRNLLLAPPAPEYSHAAVPSVPASAGRG